MRANPGGIVGPEDVIGRDELIADLWQILENQSVVLTSERRIGKTSVIRKMKDENRDPSLVCILRDLEDLESPHEFVEALYHDAEHILSRTDRAKLRFLQILSKLGGTEVPHLKLPSIKLHWKALLTALVEDLCREEQRRIVFFWDELPYFLYKLRTTSGEASAVEILDTLRSLRQRYNQLRMIFTGSVGLHHVVKDLRRAGYANAPINDMRIMEVPPLTPEHGHDLARRLFRGEQLATIEDSDEISRCVSETAGHIPFYVHWLVARLKTAGGAVSAKSVDDQLNSLIVDPHDPADFRYYLQRLGTYYETEERPVALAILDSLATPNTALSFAELSQLVRHQIPDVDDETLRGLLPLLMEDHYLARDSSGAYAFRHWIVKRWWRLRT
jgi:hypothetical protein